MGLFTKKVTPPTTEEYNRIVDLLNDAEATNKKQRTDHESEKKQETHDHELAISKLESTHEIALKEKEFELKHHKDIEISEMKDKLTETLKASAVLENENKMLREITNLNADIIDIKDLVASLIKKLPEINLTSLTVQNTGSK